MLWMMKSPTTLPAARPQSPPSAPQQQHAMLGRTRSPPRPVRERDGPANEHPERHQANQPEFEQHVRILVVRRVDDRVAVHVGPAVARAHAEHRCGRPDAQGVFEDGQAPRPAPETLLRDLALDEARQRPGQCGIRREREREHDRRARERHEGRSRLALVQHDDGRHRHGPGAVEERAPDQHPDDARGHGRHQQPQPGPSAVPGQEPRQRERGRKQREVLREVEEPREVFRQQREDQRQRRWPEQDVEGLRDVGRRAHRVADGLEDGDGPHQQHHLAEPDGNLDVAGVDGGIGQQVADDARDQRQRHEDPQGPHEPRACRARRGAPPLHEPEQHEEARQDLCWTQALDDGVAGKRDDVERQPPQREVRAHAQRQRTGRQQGEEGGDGQPHGDLDGRCRHGRAAMLHRTRGRCPRALRCVRLPRTPAARRGGARPRRAVLGIRGADTALTLSAAHAIVRLACIFSSQAPQASSEVS